MAKKVQVRQVYLTLSRCEANVNALGEATVLA
jgi:hypothetical protein